MSFFKKRKYELVPGTVVETRSGRYMAWYEHRTDIIANGDNEKEAISNLREMYAIVVKTEAENAEQKKTKGLPENLHGKTFMGRIAI
jgi:hypothetical protein